MVETLEGKLDAQPADSSETDYHRALKLPPGSSTVYRPLVPSPENVNSAVSAYYDVGPASDHELLAKLSLFAQLAKVPVFSTLRTKEQLGYIVSSGSWVTNAYAGFRVVVQSERSPEYVDERIDALWSTFAERVQGMSDEEFEKERESLVHKLFEKPKTLGQECVTFKPFSLFLRSLGISPGQTGTGPRYPRASSTSATVNARPSSFDSSRRPTSSPSSTASSRLRQHHGLNLPSCIALSDSSLRTCRHFSKPSKLRRRTRRTRS